MRLSAKRFTRNRWTRTGVALAAAASMAVGTGVFDRDGVGQYGVDLELASQMKVLAEATIPQLPIACTAGFAGPYPCSNVDLLAIAPTPEFGAALGSDIWGWVEPGTEREIALATTTFGLAFVDVTTPSAPQVLGRVENTGPNALATALGVLWRDVKVYGNHAFMVTEQPGTGMLVFDLNRLGDVTSDQGLLDPDLVYDEFSSAHNIWIHEETATAYVVGSSGDECRGGLHMIDVSDPKSPVFEGCFAEDGYTHDVECVIYDGPDDRYVGNEICFASNEDTLTIVDVTKRDAPKMLARRDYTTFSYTHQGTLSPNHEYFVFGDEIDEQDLNVPNTATYVTDVSDLENPGDVQTFLHPTTAIDHNLYFHDGYIWQANYTAGLRVLGYDYEGMPKGEFTTAGYFDIVPGEDPPAYGGAWSAYAEFPSGIVVMTAFEAGMYVLQPNLPEVDPEAALAPAEEPAPEPEPAPAPPAPEPAPEPLPATGGGAALIGVLGLALAARLRRA